MTDRLSRSVFDGLEGQLEVNKQTAVNHVNCPAGKDTRQRLYIKRIGASAFIGHCFNCGQSGYKFSNKTHRADDLIGHRLKKEHFDQVRKIKSIILTDDFPLHVQEYLLKYHVTPEEALKELGYRYVQSIDGLYMPLYQDVSFSASSPSRFQIREMGDKRARYTTHGKCDAGLMFGLVSSRPSLARGLVIVEDQISAYRVYRDSGVKTTDALALLGTNLPTPALGCIKLRGPSKILVWLDNDVAGQIGSVKIRDTLAPVLPNAKISVVTDMPQPKSLTPEKLKETLEKWMT